ncbi:MAG: TRAP transporter large permease [Deltaproteobacteria bacterium]|nr:TRAP transporter large permease [Deltaproteobacteria bacterium]
MLVSTVVGFSIFIILLSLGFHIASVLFLLGISGGIFSLGTAVVLDFGNQIWAALDNYVLTAVPLFILLGEIFLLSGTAERVYHALSLFLAPLPGGLLHANIASCSVMAACSGSSVATAATFGTIALPIFQGKGYEKRITLGSLAAGGTLGILIPPSINMIIYGSIANVSVGRLFIAGIIPGILLALSFSVFIAVMSILKPLITGKEPRTILKYKLQALPAILPSLFIIFIVMGSIYLGWATPTEAAALGVLAVIIVTIVKRRLTIEILNKALLETVKTTGMLLLIIAAAYYMNYVITIMNLPKVLTVWFATLKLSPAMTMWMLVLFYLILGCFIEAVAMMITTIPLIVPLAGSVGYDPLWFGIFITVLCEAALITPPLGLNLYVIQGVRPDKGPMADIALGSLPFLCLMIFLLGVLIYFPNLALWLPNQMF